MTARARRTGLAAVLAAGALGLAACGSDDSEGEAGIPSDRVEETATASPTAEGGDPTDTDVKPTVEVPSGPPPEELEIESIVEGDGERARKGDTISVQYVGVAYSTGEEFDSSWDRGEPFTFELGAGQVIAGWDEALVGMRVGGRRQIVIPPDMAYGAQGAPPAIGPDETLIFVVDLESVG